MGVTKTIDVRFWSHPNFPPYLRTYSMECLHIKNIFFSENYTSSSEGNDDITWTQQPSTLFPAAVIYKVYDEITEDHFIILSDDLTYDATSVEVSNNKIHEFYTLNNVTITHDYEFNSNCLQQLKSRKVFPAFARHNLKTTRHWCESNQGKQK